MHRVPLFKICEVDYRVQIIVHDQNVIETWYCTYSRLVQGKGDQERLNKYVSRLFWGPEIILLRFDLLIMCNSGSEAIRALKFPKSRPAGSCRAHDGMVEWWNDACMISLRPMNQ